MSVRPTEASRSRVPALLRSARTGHALKVAVAAALAWLLVVPFAGVADDYPYYAPLGAVVVVAGTVASSLRATMSTVAAIAIGAIPAIAALALPGPEVWALGLVVFVGAWLAGWEVLGPSASWIPISGLFILVIGASDPWRFAGAYLGLVAVGALVGLVVNTAWPPLPLSAAQSSLDRLRETLAEQLLHLSEGLVADTLPALTEWRERQLAVDRRAGQMEATLVEAREAQRVNWRAPRWRETAQTQYEQARALKSLSFFVQDIYDLIARHEHADLDEVALGPHLRPLAARAIETTAGALTATTDDGPARWQAAHDATNALAREIMARRADGPEEYFAAGAVVSTLRRALDALDPVAA